MTVGSRKTVCLAILAIICTVVNSSTLNALEDELKIRLIAEMLNEDDEISDSLIKKAKKKIQEDKVKEKKTDPIAKKMDFALKSALNNKISTKSKSTIKDPNNIMGDAPTTDANSCNSLNFFTSISSCNCRPRLMPVDISIESSSAGRLFPMCVDIKRCVGYCSSKKTECVALDTKMVKFPSIVFDGGTVVCNPMIIEEHLSCACKCAIKPSKCTGRQIFDEKRCKCLCPDESLERKCRNENKKWDNRHCRCRCPDNMMCSTGNFLDQTICKCLPIKSKKWMNDADLTNLVNTIEERKKFGRP